jgi:hypothetical protein
MGYLTEGLPEELQEFPIDVFFSYSHAAFSGKHDTELKIWSQKLAEDLREELSVSGLANLSLYLDESARTDESVDPTEKLGCQLKAQVSSAALLTLLMTPHYLRSAWCTRERAWWQERHHPDPLSVGGRIFVARVLPTDEGDWPEALQGLPGYFFFDKDKPTAAARPFTYRGSTSDLGQYNDALIKLGGDLVQRLKAVREVLDQRHEQWKHQQKVAATSGQILYLCGRQEDAPAWMGACRRLQAQQFIVNPDRPQPLPATGGLDGEYRQQLLCSDGLLILGTQDGRAVDSDMVVIGRRYRHWAIDERHASLPCAVFDMVGSALQEERRLRNAKNLGISWIDGTQPDWADRLLGWLREAA